MFLHGGAFQVGSCEAALYGPQVTFDSLLMSLLGTPQVTFHPLPMSLLGTAGSPRCPGRSELQIGSSGLVISWI